MSFELEYEDWFYNSVTLQRFSGLSTDGYGARTYSTAQTVRARVEQVRRLVRDNEGKEVVSNTTVYIPPYDASTSAPSITVSASDKITLPSGYLSAGSSQPPIISVERCDDEEVTHHFEVFL